MYMNATCISGLLSCGSYLEYFVLAVELHQGEVMSPLLFSPFIDYLKFIFAR